jgi:anti-anti-sigma regulatory factor
LYGIEVRESGEGLLVELWGELDIFSLGELERMLTDVSSRRGWTLVDLSGISFLDLQSARELVVRSLLYRHNLKLGNPSSQVMATLGALGLEGLLDFSSHTGRGSSLKSPEARLLEKESPAFF